jgi:spore maturation protein CgeB
MNAVLEQNLSAMKKRGWMKLASLAESNQDSERFEVVVARSDEPSLTVDGRSLHSRYDPQSEAAKQFDRFQKDLPDKATIILIGMGLGYLPMQWLGKRPEDRVFVYEPDPDVFRHAMSARNQVELVEKVSLYVGPDGLDDLVTDLTDQGLTNGCTPAVIEWPGVKLYADSATETVQLNLTALSSSGDEDPLRILVVGPVYGGTLSMGPYVTKSFGELGHHAELLDYSSFDEGRKLLDALTSVKDERANLLNDLTRLLGRGVVAKAKQIRAQAVFFLAQAPGTVDTLKALRGEGIVSAMWFVEDAELANWWPQVAPHYDIFFHIQGDAFTRQLQQTGARHAHYLPVAADPSVQKPLSMSQEDNDRYGSELSHVGAGYFNRRRFFLNLLNHEFKLWGNDWDDAPGLANALQEDGRRVSTEETVKIFNATQININLHSSTYAQGVNPQGDFVNPRTYELAACGAFQLVDHRSLLADQFEAGKEIAVFHNLDECLSLIEYFKAYPDEAKQIAEAGRKRVLRDHTYTHRMEEAVTILREHAPMQAVRKTGNTLGELIEVAGDDGDLTEFLSTLGAADDELALEEITEIIRNREGTLTRPEALFLLMHEFQLKAEEKGLA